MGKMSKSSRISIIFLSASFFLVIFFSAPITSNAEYTNQPLICEGISDKDILDRLVESRIAYEKESIRIQSERRKRQEEFTTCSSQKWRICWQTRIEDVEKLRVELELQNNKLIALNREIQESRNNIPLYCDRITKELFHGYDEYHCGMKQYFGFIDASIILCRNRDCKEGLTELLVKYADRIVQAINSIKDIFK